MIQQLFERVSKKYLMTILFCTLSIFSTLLSVITQSTINNNINNRLSKTVLLVYQNDWFCVRKQKLKWGPKLTRTKEDDPPAP